MWERILKFIPFYAPVIYQILRISWTFIPFRENSNECIHWTEMEAINCLPASTTSHFQEDKEKSLVRTRLSWIWNLRVCVTRTSPSSANKAAHSGFENPEQTSPEVQHRDISDPIKRTYVLQNLQNRWIWNNSKILSATLKDVLYLIISQVNVF